MRTKAKSTSKVNRHTNRQTDTRTNRLIGSIGPEGQCFEKGRGYIFAPWVPFSKVAKVYGFGPTPTSGCCEDLWSKNIFPSLDCDNTFFKKGGLFSILRSLFPRLLNHTVLDKFTVFCLFYNSVHFRPFWYRCCHPHTSRDSMSPVCGNQ